MNNHWIQQLHKKEKFQFFKLKPREKYTLSDPGKCLILFQGGLYPQLDWNHPEYGSIDSIDLPEVKAGEVLFTPQFEVGQEFLIIASQDSIIIELDLDRLYQIFKTQVVSHQMLPVLESILEEAPPETPATQIETIHLSMKYQISTGGSIKAHTKTIWHSCEDRFKIIGKNYPVRIPEFSGQFNGFTQSLNDENWTRLFQNTINEYYKRITREPLQQAFSLLEKSKEKRLQRKLKIQGVNEKFISLLSSSFKSSPDTDDELIHCLYHLYRNEGWTPVVPPEMNTAQPQEFMTNMADSSDLCMRKAKLKPHWWNFDFGNFIVFDNQSKPHVIIHKWSNNYIWDPHNRQLNILDEEKALSLNEDSFYFYKSFEAKKLSLKDLLFFELHKIRLESFTLTGIALITSAFITLIPLISGFVIDEVLPGAQIPLLWIFSGALVILGGFQVAYEWAQQLIEDRLESKMDLPTTAALWDRVLHFSPSVLQQYSAGDLSSRMGSFLSMQSFFRTSIQMGTYHIIQIVYSLALMVWVSWILGVAGLVLSGLLFVFTFFFAFLQYRAFTGGEKSEGVVNSFLFEMVNNIGKIRAAGAEVSIYSEWSKRYTITKQKGLNTQKIGLTYNSFQMFWTTLTLAVVYYLTINVKEDPVELGDFIAFLAAMGSLSASLNGLAQLVLGLGGQLPMLPYIKPLLANSPELRNDKIRPDNLSGDLKIHQLSFSYPRASQAALNNINMNIQHGSFVGVVGQSGSGKSTLAKLISTIEKPTRGKIFLDDFDLQDIDRRIIKRTISIVQQDFQVLPASIFENIKGATNSSVEDVWEVLEIVELHEVVSNLPLGLHTLLNGEASSLSGGQLQRIAMARALLLKPKIIIFDESTSALDNTTQSRIMKRLNQLEMTIIFIAHRLNTVINADQIIVLDQGNLIEKGSPEQLIENKGQFAQWLQNEEGETK